MMSTWARLTPLGNEAQLMGDSSVDGAGTRSVLGAWRAGRTPSGRPVLAAAWGFMCGIAYTSLFLQLANSSAPDPSGLSPALVVAVKAFGLALGVVGLATALAAAPVASSVSVGVGLRVEDARQKLDWLSKKRSRRAADQRGSV